MPSVSHDNKTLPFKPGQILLAIYHYDTKLHKNAGITSKKLKNDANCLNINVVTVTNDDKTEKCKTQRKAEYRKSTVFKSLPKKR